MKFSDVRYAGSNHGFTLAELLVALGLTATVLGIMVSFLMNFSRASTIQNAAAGAQQSVRAGLDYILYDIRLAGMDPLKMAGAGIEEISASGKKLRFSSDRCNLPISSSGCPIPEPDGDLDDDSEVVTYFYDAGKKTLKRCLYELPATFGLDTASGSCQNVLEKVAPNPDSLPVFTFLDDDDVAITNNNERSRIRTVILTLTVQEPAGFNRNVGRTYSSRVRLRNIGL
jgi:type II secretory pathway pseudopilin PulG